MTTENSIQVIAKTETFLGDSESHEKVESLSLSPELIDSDLITILESRFKEAQLCLSYSPMATIMLCGSLLEGLLLGLANKKPAEFNQCPASPKKADSGKVKPFNEWSLAEFIDVAHSIKLLDLDVKSFGHQLRSFRNYIHPYQQLKEDFSPTRYTAEMCLLAVKAAVSNITERSSSEEKEHFYDWEGLKHANFLALAVLLGSWEESNLADIKSLTTLLKISHDEWLEKAREILHYTNSPLTLKNGTWSIKNRSELWKKLGSRVFDQDLENFKHLAISILKEPDPAFDLPAEERYAARFHGKIFVHSEALRNGITEGLAILSNQKIEANWSQGKAEATCVNVIHDVLYKADSTQWGSLNSLLPNLAEAAPNAFLNCVEQALSISPCPFSQLYEQEGSGFTGINYMTGLLWALEILAWEPDLLIRSCIALSDLANIDPGGQWSNRPSESLITILLPWMPQTLAPIDKRKVAVKTILRESPVIGWKLLIKLLPGQHQTTLGSHKPNWRNTIPDDWDKGVTNQDYRQQVNFYANLAVESAEKNISNLLELIKIINNLPEAAFQKTLAVLNTQPVLQLPEEQQYLLWSALTDFARKHRRHSDANWALPEDLITQIENVAKPLAPTKTFNLYRRIFSGNDFDLYDECGDWDKQREKLSLQRDEAIYKIFEENGINGVLEFAKNVNSSSLVGFALGSIYSENIENELLPEYLSTDDHKEKDFIREFIWRRFHLQGWIWCNSQPREEWTLEQISQFLAYLPFISETWQRATEWLQEHEYLYWHKTDAKPYQLDESTLSAVDKLIKYDRPCTAIKCISSLRYHKINVDNDLCIRALIAAVSSQEDKHAVSHYEIVELIKQLQVAPDVNQEAVLEIEWAYLSLLDGYSGGTPKLLENKLAKEPDFFCELIQLIYRSKNDNQKEKKDNSQDKDIATNAWRLLNDWKLVPGIQDDGTFNADFFNSWVKKVEEICTASGHLDIAMSNIGEILIYAPQDPSGLWIHHTVAKALNSRESEAMRSGYSTATYNSRGVHTVDPSGSQERELAERFRKKADEVENATFSRFATTLRELADSYEHEAKRVISRYN